MNGSDRNLQIKFLLCFKIFVCWSFGWFSFVFRSGKTSKDVRSRIRNQCKQMFKFQKEKW